MKRFVLSFSILISSSFYNCNENGVGFLPPVNNKYPSKLNTEWEYNTVMIIEYYDSTGIISEIDTMFSDNTIVRVVSTKDTLAEYNNLIKFECHDLSNPVQKSLNWYSNSDSGFISIAYSNAGATQPILPKLSGKRYLTIDEFLSITNSPTQNFFSVPDKVFSDSILYYEVPRKALAYPLTLNKRWVELITPWYRERYVNRITNISFNGQLVNCYEIKVDWPGFKNMELNDFISLNYGLMKREFLADSIMITTVTHPDSGDFAKISQISNLVRISNF